MAEVQKVFPIPQYVRFEGTGKGWNGFEQARTILYLHQPVGLVAFGGLSMRGWCQVNLTGQCMEYISGEVSETLSQLVEDVGGQFKRVDIALTTKDGSVSLQTVRNAWEGGGFGTGGRRPKKREIVTSKLTDGQTIYVGQREQPKFVRAYEKGYQMAKEWALRFKAHTGRTERVEGMQIDNVPVEKIFRVELELKPKPHLFPADVLVNRDSYFSGSYPYLGSLVQAKPDTFKLTAQRKAIYEVDRALMQIRRQWGDALFTALMVHEGDMTAVWDKIVGFKHSQSLLEGGVAHLFEVVH